MASQALAQYTRRHIISIPLARVETNQELMDLVFNQACSVEGDDWNYKLPFKKTIFVMVRTLLGNVLWVFGELLAPKILYSFFLVHQKLPPQLLSRHLYLPMLINLQIFMFESVALWRRCNTIYSRFCDCAECLHH